MKKFIGILVVFCIIGGFILYLTTDITNNDTEERTYDGVIYDKAYFAKRADGLRARSYTYYIFSSKENKFIATVKSTAGKGTEAFYRGTFTGDLNNKITLTKEIKNTIKLDKKIIEEVTFKDNKMIVNGHTLKEIDVKEALHNRK